MPAVGPPKRLVGQPAAGSGTVASLVRKGFVDRAPDAVDQQQRMLRITPLGGKLWRELPDPTASAEVDVYLQKGTHK